MRGVDVPQRGAAETPAKAQGNLVAGQAADEFAGAGITPVRPDAREIGRDGGRTDASPGRHPALPRLIPMIGNGLKRGRLDLAPERAEAAADQRTIHPTIKWGGR